MSRKSPSTDRSSSENNDELSSPEDQKRKKSQKTTKKDSITNYVNNVLTKQDTDDEQQPSVTPTQITIETNPSNFSGYENISAFRRYQTNAEGRSRTSAQRQDQSTSSDDELKAHGVAGQVKQLQQKKNNFYIY